MAKGKSDEPGGLSREARDAAEKTKEDAEYDKAPPMKQRVTVRALVTMGFPFDAEPTVHSRTEGTASHQPAAPQEVQPREKPKAAQISFIRFGLSTATRRPR